MKKLALSMIFLCALANAQTKRLPQIALKESRVRAAWRDVFPGLPDA